MKTMSLSTCFFAIAFGTVGQTVTAADQPALQPLENIDGLVELHSVRACAHPGEKTDFAASDWSGDPVYHESLFADLQIEEFRMQMTRDARTFGVIVASPHKWGEALRPLQHNDTVFPCGKESDT